jgi:hypothetical protein
MMMSGSDASTSAAECGRAATSRINEVVATAVPAGTSPAGAIDALFRRFDETLRAEGFLAMSGQIVDATIVAAPKQRNTIEEKAAIKDGRIPDDWRDKPAKLDQKDRDALDGQIHQGQAARGRQPAGGRPCDPGVRLQKSRLDRSPLRPDPQLDDDARRRARWGAARRRAGSDEHGQRRLGGHGLPVGEERSHADAAWVVSRIHRKKPPGRPMPARMRIANAQKSKVRSAVEHVFAHQKGPMGLVVRTIGIARAHVKIGMANLAYNIRRFVWLRAKYAAA